MPSIGHPIQGSARRIRYSTRTADKIKDSPWQERAWDVYDRLGSVFYITRYRQHIANKIDYFPAVLDETGQNPDVDDTEGAKVLDAEGGPSMVRRLITDLIVHWDVAGEAYLVRFEEEPLWRVLSTQELTEHAKKRLYQWFDGEAVKEDIDPDNVFRVWNPHPRYHWQADSPTRHILDDAEALLLSGREIKARTHSRIAAGILWLPDTLDMSAYAEDDEGDEDAFAKELTTRMTRPIRDPGSTDALVPWIISADRADIEAVKHTTFARDYEVSLELREEARRNVAIGMDLPPELGTGEGGSMNHWGQWWLSDEAVGTHVLPTVDELLDSLTVNWYRPLLEASDVDPLSRLLWRDPSPATADPNQGEIGIKLYELGAISGTAIRRVTNFDEDDAPTPEEIEERRASRSSELPARRGEEPDGGSAVTAAITVEADELSAIDQALMTWTLEAADSELARLIESEETNEEALLLLLAGFGGRLNQRIERAQTQSRRYVERLTGAAVENPGEEQARSDGVALVLAALVAAVLAARFTPGGVPDPVGEIPDTRAPVGAIRNGLSVAGGGAAYAEGLRAWELIGNGYDTVTTLEDRGYRTLSYRWDYGFAPRVTEFPPHKALNSIEFDSWESDVLAVSSEWSWLRRPFYKPGDHQNCLCSYVRILTISLPLPVAASI